MKRRRRNIVVTVFLVVFVALGALGIIFPFHAVVVEPVSAQSVPTEPQPLQPVTAASL
jgi:hypothetical protein